MRPFGRCTCHPFDPPDHECPQHGEEAVRCTCSGLATDPGCPPHGGRTTDDLWRWHLGSSWWYTVGLPYHPDWWCTESSASWCPRCGDCECHQNDDGDDLMVLVDPTGKECTPADNLMPWHIPPDGYAWECRGMRTCPLHGPDSTHGDPPGVADVFREALRHDFGPLP